MVETFTGHSLVRFSCHRRQGLWTKIQSEYKTEKRGTIYIRQLMETLTRIGAKVYWVNSGHMVADALIKMSTKDAQLDLLLYVLQHGLIRITYCEGSWRKELKSKKGHLEELSVLDPVVWNPPNDGEFDKRLSKVKFADDNAQVGSATSRTAPSTNSATS